MLIFYFYPLYLLAMLLRFSLFLLDAFQERFLPWYFRSITCSLTVYVLFFYTYIDLFILSIFFWASMLNFFFLYNSLSLFFCYKYLPLPLWKYFKHLGCLTITSGSLCLDSLPLCYFAEVVLFMCLMKLFCEVSHLMEIWRGRKANNSLSTGNCAFQGLIFYFWARSSPF